MLSNRIREALAKSDLLPPLVLAITRKAYIKLCAERLFNGEQDPASPPPVAIYGATVYMLEDFETSEPFVVIDLAEMRYKRSYNVMRYRLLTNGEWLAKGKADRKASLRSEAEAFAEMISGMEQWERMLDQYLTEYPTPPQD